MSAIPTPRTLLLLLEDSVDAGRHRETLEAMGYHVHVARTVCAARAVFADTRVDLVIADARLADGDAHDVLAFTLEGGHDARVIVVAASSTSPSDAFSLARAGARALVERPLELDRLLAQLEREAERKPPIDPVVRAYIGHIELSELQRLVRRSALRQALALSGGSRSGAARLLRVTRQAVQHMLRQETSPEDTADADPDP